MLAATALQVARFVEEATDGLVLVAFGTSFQFNRWLSLVDYQGETPRLLLC